MNNLIDYLFLKTCSNCQKEKEISNYKQKSNNKYNSTCNHCLIILKNNQNTKQKCQHNYIQKQKCKLCLTDNENIELLKKNIISSSKISDKKYNRYNKDLHIDYEFVDNLFNTIKNCIYCNITFTYKQKINTQATIERIDTRYGHSYDNTTLCCLSCNLKKICNL